MVDGGWRTAEGWLMVAAGRLWLGLEGELWGQTWAHKHLALLPFTHSSLMKNGHIAPLCAQNFFPFHTLQIWLVVLPSQSTVLATKEKMHAAMMQAMRQASRYCWWCAMMRSMEDKGHKYSTVYVGTAHKELNGEKETEREGKEGGSPSSSHFCLIYFLSWFLSYSFWFLSTSRLPLFWPNYSPSQNCTIKKIKEQGACCSCAIVCSGVSHSCE